MLLVLAALLIGVSKTGFGGVGILGIALFAMAVPARASTGTVLPLLVTADLVAVCSYRRDVVWPHLTRLLPATAAGVIVATFAMKTRWLQSNDSIKLVIGLVILAIVLYAYWDRWRKKNIEPAQGELHLGVMIATGLLAGSLTMIANASGPLMILYLLASGLPKKDFLGTGAVFFLIVNAFKIPFSHYLGLITPGSIGLDLTLFPLVVLGAFAGKWLVDKVPQKPFERITLALTLVSALNLNVPVLLHQLTSQAPTTH